jgi:hypothetical protein
MTEPRTTALPEPLSTAGLAKQTLHLLIAAAGWVLFVYWWWLVVQRTGREQIVWTLVFIAIALAVVVLTTILWVVHNIRIFKKKAKRTHVADRPAVRLTEGERRDAQLAIARGLPPPARPSEDVLSASVVEVALDGGKKVYRAANGRALPPATGRSAR